MEKENMPRKNAFLTNKNEISFEEDDRENVLDPHDDGLVITLYVAKHFVRRILVDGDSFVNIILIKTLSKMNILESDIVRRSSVIVGFSGETKNTIGEIKLAVYIEGVNYI